MRTLWSPMGAATGNHRGTEGMPEVQKPVLEYAPTEAQNPQVTDDILAQNSTATTDDLQARVVRKMDVRRAMTIARFIAEQHQTQ
jgi:hypothetical protein